MTDADKLNLLSVLNAIREPTMAMIDAWSKSPEAGPMTHAAIWRAKIDALIAEVVQS